MQGIFRRFPGFEDGLVGVSPRIVTFGLIGRGSGFRGFTTGTLPEIEANGLKRERVQVSDFCKRGPKHLLIPFGGSVA